MRQTCLCVHSLRYVHSFFLFDKLNLTTSLHAGRNPVLHCGYLEFLSGKPLPSWCAVGPLSVRKCPGTLLLVEYKFLSSAFGTSLISEKILLVFENYNENTNETIETY